MITTIVCIAISIILVFCAAICNAKMDTVKDHWSTSIYSDATKYDPTWYNPVISWQDKDLPKSQEETLQVKNLPFWADLIAKIKPGWDPISDFWHWQKTQMLFCLIGAMSVCLFSSWNSELTQIMRIFITLGHFIVCGMIWIITFDEFYNHKLVK